MTSGHLEADDPNSVMAMKIGRRPADDMRVAKSDASGIALLIQVDEYIGEFGLPTSTQKLDAARG